MKKQHITHLVIVLIAMILVSVVVRYAAQLRVSDRSLAAVTARLSLPQNLSVVEGQQVSVPVSLDSGGNTAIGVDLDVQYNPQLLSLINIVPNANTTFKAWQPSTNTIFDKPQVISSAESTGRIQISGLASETTGTKRTGFNGQLSFSNPLVSIIFNAKTVTANTTTQLTFTHSSGNTTDSNIAIAESEGDALAGVQNATVVISDSNGPVITASPIPMTPVPTVTQTAPPTTNPTSPSGPAGNSIIVYATGSTAGGIYPQMRLWVNGSAVSGDITVDKSISSSVFHGYTVPVQTSLTGKVRVYFVNDGSTSNPYQDRNLRVQKIVVNGVDYPTIAADVFSVGVCDSSGCGSGFKRSEWLASGWWTKNPALWHTGYFEYTLK